MLNRSNQDILFVFYCVHSFFPCSEFLTGLGFAHSTEVVAEEFVGFIFT